jgi:phosphoenolpyruvate carboxykinase (ATP)
MINRERAIDYLYTRKDLYVFDGFAGWDTKYRIKVRVICARAYHGEFKKVCTSSGRGGGADLETIAH